MKKAWSLLIASSSCMGVIVACSGSADVFIPSGTSSSGASGTVGSSGGTSGTSCPPCEAPPDPSCTGTGPCGCGPYRCPEPIPDGGAEDAGADASGDAGADCVWSATSNTCGPGRYCSSRTCARGKCVPIGITETSAKSPVCGCDGVTYWNESVAGRRGMSVSRVGPCPAGAAVSCGAIGTGPCPIGAGCNVRVEERDECNTLPRQGTCWMLPVTCPDVALKQTRACPRGACTDECSAIRTGAAWYTDDACPQ